MRKCAIRKSVHLHDLCINRTIAPNLTIEVEEGGFSSMSRWEMWKILEDRKVARVESQTAENNIRLHGRK